jgi:hypothetical protein
MTENALSIYNQFSQIQSAARALQASGYFSDVRSEAQAIVKVMAGAELGLPPFASMTGIHIIQGKPALGANVIATLIKNDPRYNYRVLEHTDKVCKIQFFEGGQPCGVSEFTADDARKAGTKNMDKFPKNMLFARALSNGAKWYTPGVFGGAPVYTPDELGVEVDEDGVIIEGTYTAPEPTRQPAQPVKPQAQPTAPPIVGANPDGTMPARSAEAARAEILANVNFDDKRPASEAQLKFVRSALSALCGGDNSKAKTVISYLFQLDSSTKLTNSQARAIIDWSGSTKENGYTVNPASAQEAERMVTAAYQSEGQAALFDEAENGAYTE